MTNNDNASSLPDLELPAPAPTGTDLEAASTGVDAQGEARSAVDGDVSVTPQDALADMVADTQEHGDYDEPMSPSEVIDVIKDIRHEESATETQNPDGQAGDTLGETSLDTDTDVDTSESDLPPLDLDDSGAEMNFRGGESDVDPDATVVIDAVEGADSPSESRKGGRLKQAMVESRVAARKAERRAHAVRAVSAVAAGILLIGVAGGAGYWGWMKWRSGVTNVPSATIKINVTDSLDPCKTFVDEGLKCKATWQIKDGTKRGELISQSISAGQNVPKGSGINLVYSNGPETAKMPNVVGMPLDQAKQAIYEAGVDVSEVNVVEKPGASENTVTSSSIQAGAEVTNGNGVNLEVANGKVGIPDWIGKTKDFVEQDAKKHGIKVKYLEEDSDKTPGTVLSQSPKATESAPTNEVQVTIARSAKVSDISIPDVVGKSEQEAQSTLATAGLRKISTVKVPNCAVSSSQVTQTIPAAGGSVKSDTDVTIIVSDPDTSCSK
jgi:serine/threonine-protein kinase prkC